MEALEKLNEPLSTVRNGEPIRIATAAIVIDDLVIAEKEIQLMRMYTAMIFPLMNPTDRRTVCCFQIRKTEVQILVVH
jgi:hypothetical protein